MKKLQWKSVKDWINMEKLHNTCMRCGRKLRSTENRIRGYGDVCWKRMQTDKGKRLFMPVKNFLCDGTENSL